MIGKVIYGILFNDANVNALVSDRIFPNVIRTAEVMPAIVYDVQNTKPSNTKNGASKLDVISVDITCMGESHSDVSDLAAKVKRAMDYNSTDEYGGINVQHIAFVDESGNYNDDWGQRGVYYNTLSFNIRKIN